MQSKLMALFSSFLQKSTHVLCNTSLVTSNVIAMETNTAWNWILTRTNIRNNWPRPSEAKRVKKFGWKTRMATLEGRKIIMRRILKGRHTLTH